MSLSIVLAAFSTGDSSPSRFIAVLDGLLDRSVYSPV